METVIAHKLLSSNILRVHKKAVPEICRHSFSYSHHGIPFAQATIGKDNQRRVNDFFEKKIQQPYFVDGHHLGDALYK